MAKNVRIDMSDFLRLEYDLGKFAKRAQPFAQRMTLNNAAKLARDEAKKKVKREMILRAPNNWTLGSIRHKNATGNQPSRMFSVVGSLQKYMRDQEFGSVKRSKGKQGTPLTTSYASGEGDNARPRRKLARESHKLRNIRLAKTKKRGKNRKQRNIIIIAEAAKARKRHVFLDLGEKKGIFRLFGSLQKRRGGNYKPKLKMVQDLTHKSVVVPKNPWLRPSMLKVQPSMRLMYFKALQYQVKRQKLFLDKRGF